MTAPTTDIRALLEENPPAAGILAAADLREQRAKAVPGPAWSPVLRDDREEVWVSRDVPGLGFRLTSSDVFKRTGVAEHIAAEANPAHALAAVRRWRGVVERHRHKESAPSLCAWCLGGWPCPDLTETADEARAYLGEAS